METVQVTYLGSNDQYQEYSTSDIALVNTSFITPSFGGPTDYIELFIKDIGGTIVGSNYNVVDFNIGSNTNPQTGTTSEISLDPEADVRTQGFNRGSVNTKYNFFRKLIASGPDPSQNFWIKEISRSRTEIKTARQDLSNLELSTAFNEFNGISGTNAYYPDFLLNFGLDIQIIAVNAVYVEEEGQGYVIFKLYEPLPTDFDVKSLFWVVSQVAEPAEFNVTINVTPDLLPTSFPLRAPNFKVSITDKISKTTPYYNYASLFLTSVTSSYQQLKSMMDEKGIQINVDYSNFNNFIHFSSATERLYNFVYKLQTIESASATLASTSYSASRVTLQSEINNTIEKFDGYEYYLYFESASTSWPKSSTTQPYPLYSVTSSQAKNWLGSTNIVPTATTMSMYFSSSYYDDQNKDWLVYATPSYIQDDTANAPYLIFLDMIGQHFDNIWIYIKDLSNRYSAENNPFVGVSMDQVGDALRSFGIDLYTNTNVSDNIYYSLFGINQTGSALPVTSSLYSQVNIASSSLFPLAGQPYLTASLSLPPFGQEKIKQYVTTFATASAGVTSSFATLPAEQLKNEIYKRLYHNLAYLLKTKGTERGVKALICTYGIPDDILTVNEYGGYNIYEVAGIQELNNNNVTTGSVLNISSSLLSPYTTLQYYENNFDKTSPDIEVGFSPTDRLNAAITSSGIVTASNQPGYFNIMQYIGAPNLQYSSSYFPLDQLETTFFNATMTGNGQTGLQRFNVWDFIRTIKYYNNSLFKMMKDWVPARANLSSGIIIRSHILERNKYARHEPYVIISGSLAMINMVSIDGSDGQGILYNTSYTASVPVQYQSNSVYLGNQSGSVLIASSTGIENFTGEYSGSIIKVSNDFPQVDVSSYEYPWTSSVAPSQHAGADIMFTTYSVSYLINNVSGSVISQKFLDLDYSSNQIVPVNYGLITQSLSQSTVIGPASQSQQPYSMYAQLQDYNYYLRRSIQPRYSGSYLSGLYYNVFTTQSANYPGDISYGSDPVINYYSGKLGLFTQIATSSFIPGAVNASLAYLADVSGGLFELNQNNKSWQDLQNIFVAGEPLTIKQFDNKKYSNQVATDGVKTIYNSGYNYTPQLYFQTGSDSKLYFQFLGEAEAGSDFIAGLTGSNYFISGAVSPAYPVANITNAALRTGDIYKIFDTATPSTYFAPGNANNFPSYSAPLAGQRTFNVNLGVNFQFTDPSASLTSGSYNFGAYLDGSTLIGNLQRVVFTSSYVSGGITPGTLLTQSRATIDGGTLTLLSIEDTYTGPFINNSAAIVGDSSSILQTSFYSWERMGVAYSGLLVASQSGTPTGVDLAGGPNADVIEDITSAVSASASSVFTSTQTINYTTPAVSVGANQPVVFKFVQEGMSSANFTASLTSNSSLTVATIAVGSGGYPFASTSSGNFIQSMLNLPGDYSSITFTSDLAQFINYQFVPYFTSGSTVYSSSLYSRYGDVNVAFSPQLGDKVIMIDEAGITQDLEVFSFSNDTITVVGEILSNWVADPKQVRIFLLLRKYQDEQNVILTFNKPPGQTSYGFIIPNTVNPQITNNINTLQAAVQSQLLSTQTAVTT